MKTMVRIFVAVAFAICGVSQAQEQRDAQERDARADQPWFGVHLPPRVGAESAVIVGERPPRPVALPADEPKHPELQGETIARDVRTIVDFSKQSRASRELGSAQMWGRVSGFPSSDATVDWAAAQLRRAGIAEVRTQPIEQEPRASFWLPQTWEVRLLADPAFGPGSQDVVLESALPLAPSQIARDSLTAPLVFVGSANPSVVQHIDVKGKIAVQLVIPQGHMVFERSAVNARTRDLIERGAVAVFNLVRLPGNELSRDFGNCSRVCFNFGGRDGWFIENILDRAAQAGLHDKIRARIALKTQTFTGLRARNGVGVIRGKSDRTIVIDAHVDAWFDGAGDNADGLAVMLALARHFARTAQQPEHTLVFVISAGHHSPGINGPRSFVRANPELASKADLVINIEHVAQRNFAPARSVAADGYRHAVADSGEAPITIGVSNESTTIEKLIERGAARYGVNLVSEPSAMQNGETGGFADISAPKITMMQAPPLYHTSGETADVISTPGLERAARFLAYFIREADRVVGR